MLDCSQPSIHIIKIDVSWVPFQYPMIYLIVRSCKSLKPWDLRLELSDRSEIWQVLRQQCYWGTCQISKRCHNSNYQLHGFETSQDLKIICLIGYWNRALTEMTLQGKCVLSSRPQWWHVLFEYHGLMVTTYTSTSAAWICMRWSLMVHCSLFISTFTQVGLECGITDLFSTLVQVMTYYLFGAKL